jgi:protein translocase SecG subunit
MILPSSHPLAEAFFYASIRVMQTLVLVLPYIQIALAFLLVGGVLLQRSDASIGGALSGGGDGPATQFSRRGAEKQMFNATVIVAVLFVFSCILAYLI